MDKVEAIHPKTKRICFWILLYHNKKCVFKFNYLKLLVFVAVSFFPSFNRIPSVFLFKFFSSAKASFYEIVMANTPNNGQAYSYYYCVQKLLASRSSFLFYFILLFNNKMGFAHEAYIDRDQIVLLIIKAPRAHTVKTCINKGAFLAFLPFDEG